jgi:hypothetical protein
MLHILKIIGYILGGLVLAYWGLLLLIIFWLHSGEEIGRAVAHFGSFLS